MKRILRLFLVLILSESLIFSPLLYADQLSLPSGDLVAPEVSHTPDTQAFDPGSSKVIKATVTDNVGIKSVILFYRPKGEENYDRLNMSLMGGTTDEYLVEIQDLTSPGVEYYIQATDLAGNTLLHGYAFSPLLVNVKTPATSADGAVAQDNVKPIKTAATESAEKSNKWLWIGLGVLAVGALAAGGGGGGGGGDNPGSKPDDDTSSVTISAPVP